MQIDVIYANGRQYFTPRDVAKIFNVYEEFVLCVVSELQLPLMLFSDGTLALDVRDVAKFCDCVVEILTGGKHA